MSKEQQTEQDHSFFQLSPIINKENTKEYLHALNWAINTRKKNDIKNIALTGPYGAGKSSILKTFQDECKDTNLHFLNISLATFKEENLIINIDKELSENNQTIPETTLRKIEISILQQIFYHEEDNKIPDSRFKKIKISSNSNITKKTIISLLGILSIFWIFIDKINFINDPTFQSTLFIFEKSSLLIFLLTIIYLTISFLKRRKRKFLFHIPLFIIIFNIATLLIISFKVSWPTDILSNQNLSTINLKMIITSLSIIIIIIFLFFLIKETIILLNKISVNKLKLQNAEIEIGTKHQKSIMNQHLDEILYFFSVRPYNVVIIEDLDRFKQTEIFTKLREINLLLNQSEKTKEKNIVFIYAVRDEMFHDKDRTKFFDFIIPVIPTINSSNSSEVLLSKNTKNSFGLSEKFIEKISFIIDDMRLLHNICNEFIIYRNLLSKKLDPEKLFSITAYKNILPNDYILLSKNEGILFSLFLTKNDFIKEINIQLDQKIKNLENENIELEKNNYENVSILRKSYILATIERLDNFKDFIINNEIKTIEEMLAEDNFEYLIQNKLEYQSYSHYNNNYYILNKNHLPFTFNEIENKINNKGYHKLLNEIIDKVNNKIITNQDEIKKLNDTKILNRGKKLFELIQEVNFKFSGENIVDEKSSFLVTFLRYGYIAEDYMQYISIFHEGSLTRIDFDFFINIQNKILQNHHYKLHKIENLIKKIDLSDFKTEYVFNYNLIDFLLSNSSKYSNELTKVIEKLIDESNSSIQFIIKCYENIENTSELTIQLTSKWKRFWTKLSSDKTISEQTLRLIFISTIKHCEIKSFQKIANNNDFTNHIIKDQNFLNIIDDIDRLKEIIKTLNIEFENIDIVTSPKQLISYVIDNNYYLINIQNLEAIIKFSNTWNSILFNKSNYHAIITLGSDNLKKHINENINVYVKNVYDQLQNNVAEEITSYYKLLNNERLSSESLDLIILKVDTIIDEISNITSDTVKEKLLNYEKIEITWNNIIQSYNTEENAENNSLISFLNKKENAEILTKFRIEKENKSFHKVKNTNFSKFLIYEEGINDENYSLLTNSIPWWYDDLNLDILSKHRIEILIDNSIIHPNKISFQAIRENHKELLVEFINNFHEHFLKIIDELTIDSDDLNFILHSKILSNKTKESFLKKLTFDEVINNSDNLIIISIIKSEDDTFEISDSLITEILKEISINPDIKIKIFNNNFEKLSLINIDEFIKNLPSPYAKISIKEKNTLINDTEENSKFLQLLVNNNYINSFKNDKKGLRIFHKKS